MQKLIIIQIVVVCGNKQVFWKALEIATWLFRAGGSGTMLDRDLIYMLVATHTHWVSFLFVLIEKSLWNIFSKLFYFHSSFEVGFQGRHFAVIFACRSCLWHILNAFQSGSIFWESYKKFSLLKKVLILKKYYYF